MRNFALLLPLRWIALASASISDPDQQPLIIPPPVQNCVAQPPPGVCYSAQFCTGGNPGPPECDFYTVTHDQHGNEIAKNCTKDPKRPRCGVQADGLTCDPDNGWGRCCSEDGYCGEGEHYCGIRKEPDCPTCVQQGGCQSGPCVNRPPPSIDNTCGPRYGGKVCDPAINAGPCCSREGECGSSAAHCDWNQNCQSNCTAGTGVVNRCGPEFGGKLCDDGLCCSAHGYCGSTASHCGAGCQSGECTPDPEDNRCGAAFNNKPCPNSEDCCSKDGFCGQEAYHCRVGCQSGPCDANIGYPPPQCSSERPNQILACECQPGQVPKWQTIPNAPCDASSIAKPPGKCNTPCPEIEGAVQDFGGSSFTYHCQKTYSSPERRTAPGKSLVDCGKICSERSDCVAVNYRTLGQTGAECTIHLTGGTLETSPAEACGTLVRNSGNTAAKPPPAHAAEEDGVRRERNYRSLCPASHGAVRYTGSKRYRIHCDSGLSSPVPSVIATKSDSEAACELKCNGDSNCKGFEWDSTTGNCRKTERDISVTSKPGFVALITEEATDDDSVASSTNPAFKRLCPVQDGRTLRVGDTVYTINCNQRAENREDTPLSTQASDHSACLQRCAATDDCETVTWHPQTETCWMSRSRSKLTAARGYLALQRDGDWHYDSCYTDTGNRGLPKKDHEASGRSLTVESCQDACLFRWGLRNAGVENSNECFCGDAVGGKSRPVKEEECKKPCKGNASQKCGGFWRMNVWMYVKRA